MDWRDEAILLSARSHGETGAIVQLLTRNHGRHAGFLPGGASKTKRAMLQPGAELEITWRARLADQLGSVTMEPLAQFGTAVLDDADRLAALSAAVDLCEKALPEREAHPECYEGLKILLANLPQDYWAALYVRWELSLLAALGFGLHLEHCAVTGEQGAALIYVSPRSGRAVSKAAGASYHDRLLTLPGFLSGNGEADDQAVLDGLKLTGHFLERHLFQLQDKALPTARLRLLGRMEAKVFRGRDKAG